MCLQEEKITRSQRVAVMPARLLWPWKVFEMNLQDIKQVSSAGNRYLLVVVDRASRPVCIPAGVEGFCRSGEETSGAVSHVCRAAVD